LNNNKFRRPVKHLIPIRREIRTEVL
jgi:hypothetical protein